MCVCVCIGVRVHAFCSVTQSRHVCTGLCVVISMHVVCCVYIVYILVCVCMCALMCLHVPVENTHSDLWECRMSNTVLYKGTLLAIFIWSFSPLSLLVIAFTYGAAVPAAIRPQTFTFCNLMCGFECCNLDEVYHFFLFFF